MPALTVLAKETIGSFDKHPSGADYVIVPAVHRSTDPIYRSPLPSSNGSPDPTEPLPWRAS